jgi:tRNA pseudouridine32 synthase/23S rRNA pseudouridine746 synthase
MPPGGTGDCAAPKLLNYAFSNGLKPIAMGEFWYGKSPATAVRTHGHFYPSCTSKCGPLLSYMLKGLATSLEAWNGNPEAAIIYEDESIVAASKPSGMPSVPGLDGRISLQEYLEKEMQMDLFAVHRLDMDTSGIIIFAKTPQAESDLKKQFEEHSIRKTYMARLSPADTHRIASSTRVLKPGDKGTIELPLSPDYDERPRQKVDHTQGKPSLTVYEVVSMNEDGTTDILFYPHTGRTHQLRVHSAHILGLGRPILGDLLYGGCGTAWSDISQWNESSACIRLHLHAQSITFRHPSTSETLTLTALADPSIR